MYLLQFVRSSSINWNRFIRSSPVNGNCGVSPTLENREICKVMVSKTWMGCADDSKWHRRFFIWAKWYQFVFIFIYLKEKGLKGSATLLMLSHPMPHLRRRKSHWAGLCCAVCRFMSQSACPFFTASNTKSWWLTWRPRNTDVLRNVTFHGCVSSGLGIALEGSVFKLDLRLQESTVILS